MVDFNTILDLNPDFLEILLSYTHGTNDIFNGTLSLAIRDMRPGEFAWGCNSTRIIFRHVALEVFDEELLNTVISRLYTPDSDFITKIFGPTAEKIKIKGVNMDFVKYSHFNLSTVEYYNYLYNTLKEQTDNFNPVKLGERVIFVPGSVPANFEGIRQAYEPLTEEFKLFNKYVKSKYHLEESFKDMVSLKQFLNTHGTYYPDLKTYQKNVCESVMAESRDINGLSLEKLNSYKEKYDACALVTLENTRLYTRGRFILNMFIDLNQHVMKHVASGPNFVGQTDALERIYEFIGMSASNILKHQAHLYLDEDGYPIVPEMYCSGIIDQRLFPESINYTKIQKVCLCNGCPPFQYTAKLYNGNDGKVYIIVSLEEQSTSTFIQFLSGNRCACMFNLFMHDIDYHKLRLEALESYRMKVEIDIAKKPVDIFEVLALVKDLNHTWYSPYRTPFINMQVLDKLHFPERNVFYS